MIHVIASIRMKPGKVSDFLQIFRSNMPHVLEEKGCMEYVPTLDLDADLPPQHLDEHVVTIIEKWETLEALHKHLATQHMQDYRARVKDIVEDLSIKVLQEA